MSRKSQEYELYLHDDLEESWCVSADGDRDQAFYLPKSQVERGERTGRREPLYMFDIPDWLAKNEGLEA